MCILTTSRQKILLSLRYFHNTLTAKQKGQPKQTMDIKLTTDDENWTRKGLVCSFDERNITNNFFR